MNEDALPKSSNNHREIKGAVSTSDLVTGELAWVNADQAGKQTILPRNIAALGFLHNNPSHEWVEIFTVDYAGVQAQFVYHHAGNHEALVEALSGLENFTEEHMHGARVVIDEVSVENPEELPSLITHETVSELSSTLKGSAAGFIPGTSSRVTRKQYEQDDVKEAFQKIIEQIKARRK